MKSLHLFRTAAALVALASMPALGDEKPKANAPAHLAAEIRAAWNKAGAQTCWMRIDDHGYVRYVAPEKAGPGDVPAFWLYEINKLGLPAGLPHGDQPIRLSFLNAFAKPEKLKNLAAYPNLQAFHFNNNQQLRDEGLELLAPLKHLKWLDLSHTFVTDAGLKHLAGMNDLEVLNLSDNTITDAGLKELAGLKKLRSLSLAGTKVTDAGLQELAALPNLEHLFFNYTTDKKITDAGIKELLVLNKLQTLDLGYAHLTDAGLKDLAQLKHLRVLRLYETPKITEKVVEAVAGGYAAALLTREATLVLDRWPTKEPKR